MPEINPYEPPHSELRSTPSVKSRTAVDSTTIERWFVASLLSLQIMAGVLTVLAISMQVNKFISFRRMQTLVELFGMSFFVLGIAVLPLALMRGSGKLVVLEILALVTFVWLTLPAIH